ncbi:MAG: hypothetical protein JO115_19435 [Pseudonocardiales bacterium]|nr:hypothetical protein [Pseudonocardiales bacterium]
MSATEMPEVATPARPYRFTDVDGTAVYVLCRVEQIAVDPESGAMSFRLHQQGQVVGWDTTWLHVCFAHHQVPVLLQAHLVRVLDPEGSP